MKSVLFDTQSILNQASALSDELHDLPTLLLPRPGGSNLEVRCPSSSSSGVVYCDVVLSGNNIDSPSVDEFSWALPVVNGR